MEPAGERLAIRDRIRESKDLLERITTAGASGVFTVSRAIVDEIVQVSADLIGVMIAGEMSDADAVYARLHVLAQRVCPEMVATRLRRALDRSDSEFTEMRWQRYPGESVSDDRPCESHFGFVQ